MRNEAIMDTEQIFQAIRGLPVDERRRLVERITLELEEVRSEPTRKLPPPEDPFFGMLTDEPELADEILEIATRERHEGRDACDDENAS
jgi:hypothetical protein